MKVGDLIQRLQDFPQDMEVCIFDDEENFFTDNGKGSYYGIYPVFSVHNFSDKFVVPDNPERLALAFQKSGD